MALRPLDPAIVNAYQPPKFNMPDPLQDVAALEQIKSGRVARQLHEQQLAQLQRDSLALDKLRSEIVSKGGPPNLKEAFTAMINSGVPHFVDAGIKGFQKIQDQENFANLLNPKAPEPSPEPAVSTAPVPGQAISMKPVNAPYGALATPETDRVNQLAAMSASKPEVANMLTPDMVQLNNRINAAYALGTPQSLKFAESLERQRDEANKIMSVAPGGNLVQGGKVIYTAPSAPQRPIGVSRGETLYGPNGEVIARGMAPEAPAPTITEIRNPQNPDELIRVDARTGRVIGVSGKEPAAAAREAKAAVGKNELSSELDNIRAAYNNLNEMRAIPSTGRNVLSNIAAGTASSGVGQAVGRLAGTPEQTERDVIKSGRLRLVNAIKNATGMSAQQLNSNVELKNMLDSVTDPSQSIETVNRILDQIQETYLNGAAPAMGRPAAAKPAARPSAAAPAGKGKPSVDDLLKKYGG
jgi:hypothetical protein